MLGLAVKVWYTGTNPSHYKHICLEGHTYHVANFMSKIATAIKLDDDGKPIKCTE